VFGALTERGDCGWIGCPNQLVGWCQPPGGARKQEGPTGAVEFCSHASLCGWEVVTTQWRTGVDAPGSGLLPVRPALATTQTKGLRRVCGSLCHIHALMAWMGVDRRHNAHGAVARSRAGRPTQSGRQARGAASADGRHAAPGRRAGSNCRELLEVRRVFQQYIPMRRVVGTECDPTH
jgi:hypothetical protein